MGIPLPPGFARNEKAESGSKDLGPAADSKLSGDETSFILKATLLPEHAQDPNILKWIASYLICRDARQAAREVGLTARSGDNLIRRPDIYEAIRKVTQRAVMKNGYDAAEIVARVKEIATVDLADFEQEDGSYIEKLSLLPPEVRRAIKKFKVKNEYEQDPNGMKFVKARIIEVELWDKMKSLELLGREEDLFAEKKKVEHGVSADMRSILLESTKRAEEHKEKTLKDVTATAQLTHGKSVGSVIEAEIINEGIDDERDNREDHGTSST